MITVSRSFNYVKYQRTSMVLMLWEYQQIGRRRKVMEMLDHFLPATKP